MFLIFQGLSDKQSKFSCHLHFKLSLYINILKEQLKLFSTFFSTKISCLFYCFSRFTLSENRKVQLIRVFSPAGRGIWFERVGVQLIQVNSASLLRKRLEILGEFQKVRITEEFS